MVYNKSLPDLHTCYSPQHSDGLLLQKDYMNYSFPLLQKHFLIFYIPASTSRPLRLLPLVYHAQQHSLWPLRLLPLCGIHSSYQPAYILPRTRADRAANRVPLGVPLNVMPVHIPEPASVHVPAAPWIMPIAEHSVLPRPDPNPVPVARGFPSPAPNPSTVNIKRSSSI